MGCNGSTSKTKKNNDKNTKGKEMIAKNGNNKPVGSGIAENKPVPNSNIAKASSMVPATRDNMTTEPRKASECIKDKEVEVNKVTKAPEVKGNVSEASDSSENSDDESNYSDSDEESDAEENESSDGSEELSSVQD
eukprot:CAMPEP_0205804748 /NCGR_PEP_ID=MMETSP0205-20121125/7757_1 /ASSEMBLY_ACC=CAM_ASM_000278 /TAXON_ID=36767 /ORGANISM="Euplotes focardii, Strain TN1" /LENGTH=135 /DNA_ID=CAMNT_0053074847 /DNA_START=29 /DNA_END=436 /DNA_ORIENTATION=-